MSNILIALEITALGMGLVFGAIVLLWWMMALLTSLMAEKEPASDAAEAAPVIERDFKSQAAAVAVAIALAEQQASHAHPLPTPPTAIVSAWQLGMRTRQLSQKGMPNARQVRKVR
jgi:Na+-transporting methylmalonyl-CoA/oxaloacetate decarboxylase gamma subunit